MFALVDCNSFYASCERVFRPDLNGKPVVVLSNNDGCVIARTQEAKNLGIPMGTPAYKYRQLFIKNQVEVFSSNFALYGDMSNRVMNILQTYSPDVEIYSIDEAFIKLDGFANYDLYQYGQKIINQIKKWLGLPISIGIAPTKVLAKAANKIAKDFPERTAGLHIIDDQNKKQKALRYLSVGNIWGIGRRYAKKLNANGIRNAWDYINQNDEWINHNFTIVGLRIKHELQGISKIELEIPEKKKTIATTRSFSKMFTDIESILERVTTFAVSCGQKLRAQNSVANQMMVFIHSNPFREDLSQYSQNIVLPLPYPTNSDIELAAFATAGLKKIFKNGFAYKKAGVIVMDLADQSRAPKSLFENSDPRHQSLMRAVDKINLQFGQHKIHLASQYSQKMWRMRQERLSPKYSTNINDIIQVK